jgi:excisionase family DNA binding protein
MYRPKLAPAANVKPRLHSVPTTGKLLGGVHNATVSRLVAQGKLRATKIGSRRMIFADSIDELLADKG